MDSYSLNHTDSDIVKEIKGIRDELSVKKNYI